MKRFVNYIKSLMEFAVFLIICLPLALLPNAVSARGGEALGMLIYHLWASRRKVALDNITGAMERGAIPHDLTPDELARKNFRHMGRSIAELNKLLFGFAGKIIDSVSLEGQEYYRQAEAKGKGVIIVGGHCGNWELMFSMSSVIANDFYGVVRKQRNPFMNSLIVRNRERFGSRIIYKQGALRAFLKALKAGDTVGVAVDQAGQSEGVRIDFLGAPAWTTRMPAILAKRTGAAIVPVFNFRKPDGTFTTYAMPEVEITGDDPLRVTWHLPETSDTVGTFDLSYRILGVVRQSWEEASQAASQRFQGNA